MRAAHADPHDTTSHIRHLIGILTAIREQSDLTQRDLAMLMRLPRNTVWRWENCAMATPTEKFVAWTHHLGLRLALVDQDGRVRHLDTGATDRGHAARATCALLAEILRAERLKFGLIRIEVAEAIGAAPSTVRHWEQHGGTPTLANLDAWCRELGYKITIAIPADHPSLRKPRTAPTAAQLSWAA